MNFKQNDTKALRSKSLLNEIESVYDEVRPLSRGLALLASTALSGLRGGDRRAVPARLRLTQEGALRSAEGRLLSSPPPRWTFFQVTGAGSFPLLLLAVGHGLLEPSGGVSHLTLTCRPCCIVLLLSQF